MGSVKIEVQKGAEGTGKLAMDKNSLNRSISYQ
jgi:hypothetical protein